MRILRRFSWGDFAGLLAFLVLPSIYGLIAKLDVAHWILLIAITVLFYFLFILVIVAFDRSPNM